MVRELNMDTQRQNFWKESINKEATVRLAWHTRYSGEVGKNGFRPRKRPDGVQIKRIETEKPKTSIERLPKLKPASKHFDLSNAEKTKIKDLKLFNEMRPVSGGTRSLLYKGFSAIGEGRYAYLQTRKHKKPEDKYEFPVTSGWEYGWKVNSAMKNSSTKPAVFGRTRIVRDSFYRTSGVLPQEEEFAVKSL